ncbi:MAG TPA: hypothetical protein VEK55_17635 [Xanthobacteraceae bacterium]|nr:hypothetical protein [Xanthobacteraceae bacterium]
MDVDLDRAGSLNVDQMLNASRKANSSNEVSTQLTFDYEFVDHPGYNADRGPANIFAARAHCEFWLKMKSGGSFSRLKLEAEREIKGDLLWPQLRLFPSLHLSLFPCAKFCLGQFSAGCCLFSAFTLSA